MIAGTSAQATAHATDRMQLDPDGSRLRLQTTIRLRWFAVIGQIVAIVFVFFFLNFDLPIGWCLLFIALSAWLNIFLRLLFPVRYRLDSGPATLLLAYDICQLSALLYLTGGIENPFTVLLIAPVTVSAANLRPRNTVLLGCIALAAAASLIVFHQPLPWFAGLELGLPTLYKIGVVAGLASCMMFIALYGGLLSKEGRQMSAALAATELVLAREQKLHALDGLAAAAAHELGTPLSTIVLVTGELQRETVAGSPQADDLALLRSQAQRCRDILQTLTRKPSENDPLHASLTVGQLIEEAVAPHRAMTISIEIDAGAYVGGEPRHTDAGSNMSEPVGERRPGLIYGVANLIENAVEFARSKVQVTARWNEREVMIAISDDGPGIAPEVIEALGEPYVTTRRNSGSKADESKATGLGLGFFIAKTLLERSGAGVAVANNTALAQGACVTLTWQRHIFEGTEPEWSAFPGRQKPRASLTKQSPAGGTDTQVVTR
jgi:two-component system, sensor histidine kinase RegB